MPQPEGTSRAPTAEVRSAGDAALALELAGDWRSEPTLPDVADVLRRVEGAVTRVDVSADLDDWGSGLLTYLMKLASACDERGVTLGTDGLPDGARRLLKLAAAVPEREGARRRSEHEPFLAYVGNRVFEFIRSCGEMLEFLGSAVLAFGRLLRGKAVFRRVDLGLLMEDTGAHALPIIALISALVGMILAFVGAFQLKMFGAEIYIAAMVGLGTVREMGPMMAGILIAGRTGATFAAQIGTMQVNDEVDALQTMGISPMDFLVLPRMLALAVMMPLLCIYADLFGIAGGAVVGAAMFDIPLSQYFAQTWEAVGVGDFVVGIGKSVLFGLVIAVAGCMRGMQCGRSASAVGEAATSAVVTGIVAIIVLDSLAAIVSTVVGI